MITGASSIGLRNVALHQINIVIYMGNTNFKISSECICEYANKIITIIVLPITAMGGTKKLTAQHISTFALFIRSCIYKFQLILLVVQNIQQSAMTAHRLLQVLAEETINPIHLPSIFKVKSSNEYYFPSTENLRLEF